MSKTFIGKGGAILPGYPGAADIIASKRAAGRKGDLAELEPLEEFEKVYAAARHARKPA